MFVIFLILVFLIMLLIVGYTNYKIIYEPYFKPGPVPQLDDDEWWGAAEEERNDNSVKKFTIKFTNTMIDDLKQRLKNTKTLTPPLEGIQQQYGFNTKALKSVIDYWANQYDWPAREKFLNQFPQFKTNIQGLNIHFIHVKPEVPEGTPVLPLLLIHGWPGSVREFYKVIPILTKVHERYGYAFEVVVPSLPGFGFSDGAIRPGLGAAQISVIFKNLMLRLGHERFYVQGGDWGSTICSNMAILFPEHVAGLHTNMPKSTSVKSVLKTLLGSIWPPFVVSEEHESKMYPLSSIWGNLLYETGYFHIQATKPDTIGIALNDSPAGLAAYILEKFSTATNRTYRERDDAGLLEKFTYDELIDNLMYYWIPQAATTSGRIYAETFNKAQRSLGLDNIPISKEVPCAAAFFPNDLFYHPDWILKDTYQNLVHRSDFKEGGHFAAFENPELLAEDVFVAIDKMRYLTSRK